MDSLPHDILVHICQFLSLSCRKRVRTVNKRWNEACCDPRIIKRERFKIGQNKYFYYTDEFFATLIASNRTIINLKFSSFEKTFFYSDDEVSSQFWLKRGTRVRSLEFGKFCRIETDKLFEILKCCPNLNELCAFNLMYHLDDVFKSLLDNDVILKKVSFLGVQDFFFDDRSSCLFENLHKVFPNVRKLSICPIFNDWDDDWWDHRLEDIFCPSWNYVLSLSSNLQYLELGYIRNTDHNPSDLGELESLTKILAAVKQIRTLQLGDVDILNRSHVIQLRDMKNLSMLCINAKETTLSVCELLIEMLDNLPKLRHLVIIEALAFGWNNNVVEKLVTSSLEMLKIVYIPGLIDEVDIVANNITYNDTLKDLVLYFSDGSIPDSICLFFIKYFRRLQTLSFAKNVTSSNVMESLRIHQTKLYGLIVTIKTADYPHWDSIGPHMFSFRQFQYLEVLNLKIISNLDVQFSFRDFVLPRLTTLEVEFDMPSGGRYTYVNSMNLVNFVSAIEKLPCLKWLRLSDYCEEIPMNLALRLCESLKNLERLYLYQKNYSTKENVAKCAELSNLFRVRESLRLIAYDCRPAFKNIITQEIEFYS